MILQNIDQFDDIGPCVIMASPGMMQSGLSRQLFEAWCTDKRNGVIIAGYCVEGTLAKVRREGERGRGRGEEGERRVTTFTYASLNSLIFLCLSQHVMTEPSEIVTTTGQKLPLRMSVGTFTAIMYKILQILTKFHTSNCRLHLICCSH